MSYADALTRISQIQSLLGQVSAQGAEPPASLQPSSTSFSTLLQRASTANAPTAAGGTGADSPGTAALEIARTQLGVTEQPPGSNDGPDIARYRAAVAASYAAAPWCAYFVSWCAAQAGAPIGDGGRGEGSVEGITAWAERTGRLTSDPKPGDLILFGTRHVGIVESVNADGSLTTIEGNSSDGVNRRHHTRSEATGFVRL